MPMRFRAVIRMHRRSATIVELVLATFKSMKLVSLIALLFACGMALAQSDTAPRNRPRIELADRIVAVVNNEVITYRELEQRVARVVAQLRSQGAPLPSPDVLARQVLAPPDLERVFGLTGGNIFQGAMTPGQLFSLRPLPGWASYRTPVRGLYLCGAAAHPGGGVMGTPGHNAAREILRARRRFRLTI